MAANMCKNSLKNVEFDDNKILYKMLLDFFYSEMVLTSWISLVQSRLQYEFSPMRKPQILHTAAHSWQ